MIRVELLGRFHVERADLTRPISDWQRRSAKTLTKLLATHPAHALHREQILDLLWPNVEADSALNSFGKALHAARRAFEPGRTPRQASTYLRLTDSMLMLTEHVTIDVDRFESLAEEALLRRDLSAYESALAAYRGELLPEDRYEDWCQERRHFVEEVRVRLLLGVAEVLEQRGAFNEAADRLREVLQHDPTREEIHRRLMRLYAETGQADHVVRQFQICEKALSKELGIAPEPATTSLYLNVVANRAPRSGPPCEALREVAPPHRITVSEPAHRTRLVGRGAELEQLYERLERDGGREAGVVLLAGEAGAGKTRLLEELASAARDRGAAVLWGGCGAHARNFAGGAFAVALEDYAGGLSGAEREALADRYQVLARLVPSLWNARQSPRPAPVEPWQDVIPEIARLLSDLGHGGPTLVALGDLNAADAFTLDLLRYLAQLAPHKPWLIVGTVREEDAQPLTGVRGLIDALVRERLCEMVDVPRLTREECDQLVVNELREDRVGGELLAQIYARSRGNPLFAEELIGDIRASGQLDGANGIQQLAWLPTRVPARVRALTAIRLRDIDATTRRVIGLAAVATATQISLAELCGAAAALRPPIPDAVMFDVLDRALQAGFLEERDDGFAFRHPMLRSAIYQELPEYRRQEFSAALDWQRSHSPQQLAISLAG